MTVPFPMVAAMDVPTRHAQMAHAIQIANARGYPRLTQTPIDYTQTISIACYGPSLADTWQDLRRPILSMSGATRFLADRGVIADYHVDMDPRAFKTQHLDPPIDGVHYLMASVCPPKTWELLKDQQVTLWHAVSCHETTVDFVAQHERENQPVLVGGMAIGLAALHVAGHLGYGHFEIHGMDGCFADATRTARHAGPHYGTKQTKDGITWDAGKVTYHTSRIMANQTQEMLNCLAWYPIFCVFHGRGLTQALVRKRNFPNACCADEPEKAATVRAAAAYFVTPPTPKVSGFLDAVLANPPAAWVEEIRQGSVYAETLRPKADFNTGTISAEACLVLRALCELVQPQTIVEVGTFIGTSALAMRAGHVYTCDKDNDCLPSSASITCFPKTGSTAMLQALVAQGVKADLFFFDGRIQEADLPLIQQLSTPDTVYVFDDHYKAAKGVINVARLVPCLPPTYQLVLPSAAWREKTTIAVLAPPKWT